MKKIISFMLAAIMLIATIPLGAVSVNATIKHTASESVLWAKNKASSPIDYDGVYGVQCVDLILAYYDYLGVSPVGGNACDYAYNSLPSRWNRIPDHAGFVPSPGDIAVWTYGTDNYGHVAIILEADSYTMTVAEFLGSTHTGRVHTYSYYGWGTFYGVIRPDFVGEHTHDLNGGFAFYEAAHPHYKCYYCSICGAAQRNLAETRTDENCSYCQSSIAAPGKPEFIGLKSLYKDNEEITFTWTDTENTTHNNLYIRLVESEEDTDYTRTYETIHYAENGLTRVLPAGHYRVLIQSTNSNASWIYTDGDWTYIKVQQAECQHDITTEIISAPTCTAGGLERQTCSICGEIWDREIAELGHNYEAVVTAPTCTEQGYTTYTCTRCGDSYVGDVVPATGHNFVDGVCTVCGAADPDYVPVDPNGPKASVAEAVAKAGEDVEISVTLDNTPEIKSMAISDVTFNLETLALLGGEWNVDNSVLSSWDGGTGKGVVTLKSAEDLNGNVVFTLTFHVSDAADEGFYSISLKVSAKDKNNAAINVATVTGGVTVRNYIVGDVNGDETITDEDAIYLLFYTFFPEDYPIEQPCDFNGDGEVTDEDAIYLLFYTFFPEEYPIG